MMYQSNASEGHHATSARTRRCLATFVDLIGETSRHGRWGRYARFSDMLTALLRNSHRKVRPSKASKHQTSDQNSSIARRESRLQ